MLKKQIKFIFGSLEQAQRVFKTQLSLVYIKLQFLFFPRSLRAKVSFKLCFHFSEAERIHFHTYLKCFG
jgi:hypothetical protein